ncbi:MAG TPA: ABC transporter permease [Firmicutes bacterium]|nr:ABC transporter permease [Bacillota bacterium]
MAAFIGRRFISMLITLVLVSVVGFIVINLPPGSYLDVYRAQLMVLGTSTAEQQIKALEKRYALDKPLYYQYLKWITGFVRGDFGRSFQYNREVSELVWNRLGFTVVVSVCSLVFSWIVALPIGIYSATHKYSAADNIFTFLSFIGLSIPSFLIALVLMVISSRYFGMSVGGLFSRAYENAPWSWAKLVDFLQHLWIPVVVVGLADTAGLMRVMRGNLSDILSMQYVQTARAKGLPERVVIYKHAVRNALHPLIMNLGMSLPGIISGSTVVSIVLSLPTCGPLYFNALRSQDMFLAGTFLVFMAIMLVIGNFLADIALAMVDPRIRYE